MPHKVTLPSPWVRTVSPGLRHLFPFHSCPCSQGYFALWIRAFLLMSKEGGNPSGPRLSKEGSQEIPLESPLSFPGLSKVSQEVERPSKQ